MTLATGMHYLLAFVFALAILVVVHELGHYLVAIACNVKVKRFSFGFGRVVWLRRVGNDGTEWTICAIPLGGYVKMLDEAEGVVAEHELHRAFNRQSLGRRALIVVAGPIANLILACLLFAAVYFNGVYEFRPLLAMPATGTVAAAAGIEGGSCIVRLNGTPISTWQDVRWAFTTISLDGGALALDVLAPTGAAKTYVLELPAELMNAPEKDGLGTLGLKLQPLFIQPIVGSVIPESIAETAGVRPGDRLLSIDGETISSWHDFAVAIRHSPGRIVSLKILREPVELTLQLMPATVMLDGKEIGRVGLGPVLPTMETDPRAVLVRFGFFESLGKGAKATWDTSILTLRMMGRMLLGNISWKNISGPVTIADYAGQSAQLGANAYFRFLALISISLGVLNLLPIPVLDGGHLLYYLIEGITGKPIQEQLLDIAQRVGMALLGMLMLFAFYNDLNRLISG